MRTLGIALGLVALSAGAALAGGGSGAPAAGAAGAAEKKPATPPAMPAMPTPPQELLDMAKTMGGTFKCIGTMHTPGGDVDVTANVSGKLDLDKMWWHESMTQTKAKQPYHFDAYVTYDATAKKWMRVAVDNMGVVETTTSPDRLTWTGTASGQGMSAQVKTVATPGDKEIKLAAQMSVDGKTWNPSFEMDCKK